MTDADPSRRGATRSRSRSKPKAPAGETPKSPLLQPVDDASRALARRLVRTARYGALATLDPAGGHPLASRVALATDVDGTPLILISSLSGHTGALVADARCSLLCGEPGRGDPLAHARITVVARARRVERADEAVHARVRRRYLARQPKAALYADFGDFAFWRLEIERASLNGGFGRAFELQAGDVLSSLAQPGDEVASDTDARGAFADLEAEAVAHMNDDHPQTAGLYATALAGGSAGDWRLATIDPHGFELVLGDEIRRVEFEAPVHDAAGLHGVLIALARRARQTLQADAGSENPT